MDNKKATCGKCSKPFFLVPAELAFYQEQGFPEPAQCYQCRQAERLALRNERAFNHVTCKQCGKDFLSTRQDDGSRILYCKPCFEEYLNKGGADGGSEATVGDGQ